MEYQINKTYFSRTKGVTGKLTKRIPCPDKWQLCGSCKGLLTINEEKYCAYMGGDDTPTFEEIEP
jgi:hypothetical protein